VVCDGKEIEVTGPTHLEGHQVRIQLIGRALPGAPDCGRAEWCNYTFDEADIRAAAKFGTYDHSYPIESAGPRRPLTLDEGIATGRDFVYQCRMETPGCQTITTQIELRQ
jgi:hypothetical protein